LLGIAPSAVGAMPARDVVLLSRYWAEEPWGAWRDNLHAAIIAREVARLTRRRGARIELKDFMVVNTERRRQDAQSSLVAALKAIAVPRAPRDRSGKTGRKARG
jgi:hypothetical protein